MQDVARPLIFCCGSRVFYFFCVIFAPHFGHAGKENTQTGYKEEKDMQQLKERILRDGKCFEGGILKVDNFINHQMDPILMKSMAVEFVRRFASRDINKILTIEASGIAPAIMVGYLLELPVVFAKKKKPSTMENMLVTKVFSFTKNNTYDVCVCKDYLQPGDKVLFIDDFLPMAMRPRA